ncbi:MAG: hypothetical protein M0P04_02930 [Syntrophales bacterium]|jgi:hypothetical protein|nr:hypothetical protein [Syntrophales bacterium]MDD4338388.1 hypothetical protein [Syntrophales bacterium]HOG06816.1 hypothetical protein [Syntrophales bacterium]HOS78453.1 hypothetical protein [Syntrophales bacterium]HPB70184.1 hypothetical protein [Syntrophales bacterium]
MNIKKILLLAGAAVAVYVYVKQPERKKRFLREILRQVPYLIPRYFA